MRENIAFNHYLSNDGVTELAIKYGFTNTSIGKTSEILREIKKKIAI